MLEVFSWLYKNNKSGKFRSNRGIIGYAVMYLLIFGFLGSIFYGMASALCKPLASADMGWLYWALMGIVGIFLGVFGSVFNTYSSLYQAKDNDLLLCMPIPASKILLARLSGVYAMGLMYELIVMVPVVIVWLMTVQVSVRMVIFTLLIPLVMSFLVLVLSAVLGWVVAIFAGRVKHKSIVTMLVSIAFIVAYYYFCVRAYDTFQSILLNAGAIGAKLKVIVYPLYHMGKAAEGNVLSMLIFFAVVAVVLAVMYVVMATTFYRLVTANHGSSRKNAEDMQNQQRRLSIRAALLQKELLRFVGSSNYMLNCGLGIIMMPIAAVLFIWKAEFVHEVMMEPLLQAYIPAICLGAMCFPVAMNDMTAPSVSLEGKNLWILRSLPVSAEQVLRAKLEMHLLLTVIPAVPLIASVIWVMRPAPVMAALCVLIALLFIVLTASLGLTMNLKRPNLSWTNEIIPIKQSAAVMAALLGGMAIAAVIAGVYILMEIFFGLFGTSGIAGASGGFNGFAASAYFAVVCVLLLAVCGTLLRWIFTKGTKVFKAL